jgi:hypothetical protein
MTKTTSPARDDSQTTSEADIAAYERKVRVEAVSEITR